MLQKKKYKKKVIIIKVGLLGLPWDDNYWLDESMKNKWIWLELIVNESLTISWLLVGKKFVCGLKLSTINMKYNTDMNLYTLKNAGLFF